MAMSQKDMLKRARQLIKQKTTIVGASPSAPPPRADLHEKISEPNPEPLTRKFKPRVDDTEISFWHPQFHHSQHGRKHNFLRHDANLLKTQDLKTLHESILANLHKVEVSSFMLMDQFTNLSAQKTPDLEQKEQSLVFSQTENSRLIAEVAELATPVKKKDELLSDLNDQLTKLETEKQAWILKEKYLLKSSELLKDQISSSLNMDFNSHLIKFVFSAPMQIYPKQTSPNSLSTGSLLKPTTRIFLIF
ncbi:hypothetical protein DEO72_LG7g1751 [Vigna unguiculata]|uniref:Uncharacterized protein n=1 Tax=Vigna unguiculata TaxID=3917 RepID=A0A4D6MIB0_VIGUN|nr:hypothetical protein DEO72_LG7g1751 [Vigna unguiculata]